MKPKEGFGGLPTTRSAVARLSFAGLGLLLGGATAAAQGVSAIEHAKPGDWPSYHRTYDAQQYSPLDQINKDNVKKLHVAWTHQPGDITQGLQATPIAVDGSCTTRDLSTASSR
jgi:alcohol dehydrogenase (cytochrome c)